MKISTKLSAIAFSILAVLSTVSCEKPAPETEDNGNTFTYEGNTYKVRSVVLYELENNMTQIWMSETAGYTTVDEIEASVGELVLTIPTGKIGNGKQSAQDSPATKTKAARPSQSSSHHSSSKAMTEMPLKAPTLAHTPSTHCLSSKISGHITDSQRQLQA